MTNSALKLTLIFLCSITMVPHTANAMGRRHKPSSSTIAHPSPSPTATPRPTVAPTATPSATPQASATPVATQPTNSTHSPLPGAAACASSDPNHICMGVKIVSYLKNGKALLTQDEAIALISRVSKVWAQCNVEFQLERYQAVDPTLLNMDYKVDWYNDADTVRGVFRDDTRFLMIATGALVGQGNSTTGVTWLAGEGYGFNGSLIDGAYAKDELTVAHEFGHYQGLEHVESTSNLLYPYAEDNNHSLSASQCNIARNSDYHYWQSMFR